MKTAAYFETMLLILKRLTKPLASAVGLYILFLCYIPPACAADLWLERGKKLFRKCVHCHTYKQGQAHRIGPNLHGMFGRKAGAVQDFEFSPAWTNADFIWTEKTLDDYLVAPHQMIPGNRMPFDGLSRREDRRALIYYMKNLVTP